MDKLKIALVGVGGISQVVRIPILKKMEDVDLIALCDIDEAKVSLIAEKFDIPHVYYDIQNLFRKEQLDGVFLCTPNNLHYPMALASIENGISTLVERPVALNADQAERLLGKAKEMKTNLMIGMNNRFREDAITLKDFLEKNELGDPFYIKTGWLRKWGRQAQQNWLSDEKISGGGVIIDMGAQLIDLALWLIGKPKVKSVRAHSYKIFSTTEVEDAALAVLEAENNVVITVEVAWRLHLEKDMLYTHVFGKQGGAFMNPLRLLKELHGNLVNVTPISSEKNVDIFRSGFEKEIRNFINVIKGEEEPVTPPEDGVYLMKLIDAIYDSARQEKEIVLEG